MNVNRFTSVVQEFLDHEEILLGVKRTDYAKGDQDCLINFKGVSGILEITPQSYCMTLIMKHIHSIIMTVRTGGINPQDWCWSSSRGEGMKQHISDARNYLVLLAALIDEEMDKTIIKDDDERD